MRGYGVTSITMGERGQDERHQSTAGFTYRGRPLYSVNNTACTNARERPPKYEERLAEPAPVKLRKCMEQV
jgi:hypothetical protein